MEKQNIFDLSKEELSEIIKPAFRAKQIYQWLYQKYVNSFDEMKNLPKELKDQLEAQYYLDPLVIAKVEESRDGSKKYLFALKDGNTVESVLLPMKQEQNDEEGKLIHHTRYTICISSQVGCKIGCAFCLTGKSGFKRNLTAGEITSQILMIKRDNAIAENRRVNIVYMGMGEPLDNLANVSKAVRIFTDIDGLSISPRRQTISTSGLSSQIEKLGLMELGVLLAISLHAVDDELRQTLMPINKAYNIESIINAVKAFPIDARKRVMFEYLVMKGVNDDQKSARKLVKLLHGIKSKVNLIYFNPHVGSEFARPLEKDMIAFQQYLVDHGVLCTIRQSKGLDISAACGQLKDKEKNNDNA
ncbi:23S rRNA (adenine(2503)-C(2))-methyltransferase RlmN [Sulfurospirillum diekertiae]|uniref:Probable dual-specificity RNA methyltransferase RlmN n=1 Tax=Sulfurospirillum diekertiae TaxID=1854492 RepID=A0A1Y0HIU4_9BACT|nr:23S rRNA (adenine(2503)-C(2))-methyltransferase RlmN [Sulfurospirillum diekertiae]ARU47275.1 putative dual-specificity RNA methyltransferase RlmN [Sulfurospirillum diekertiae]ASC92129.1 putative dual-specificity RNA methyltransferase RlmN [Sulfurospirillum diekertiae]